MDKLTGYVYLHSNKSIQWKPNVEPDLEELADSPFVLKWWSIREVGETPQAYCEWIRELYQDFKVPRETIEDMPNTQALGKYVPGWRDYVFSIKCNVETGDKDAK